MPCHTKGAGIYSMHHVKPRGIQQRVMCAVSVWESLGLNRYCKRTRSESGVDESRGERRGLHMDGHIQGGIQRTEDRHEVGTEAAYEQS